MPNEKFDLRKELEYLHDNGYHQGDTKKAVNQALAAISKHYVERKKQNAKQ